MHPALSVIVFTVASGAGFGLVTLTLLLALLGLSAFPETMTGLLLGIGLATLGLLSSTLHLANPRNAWRAFMRFRSSWLSREAVFALAFYPVIGLFLLAYWSTGSVTGWALPMAIASMVLAMGTVFTTGMIYASLRTIPQWNSALVPANYLLLALASGAVLALAVKAPFGGFDDAPALLALALVAIAGASKVLYFQWIGKPQGPTINTALGITRGRARLLESGQSADNFLNREFGYRPDVGRVRQFRWLTYLCAFLLPLGLVLVSLFEQEPVWALPAAVLMIAGLLAERWLFFAEARHTVNLFYGRQRC